MPPPARKSSDFRDASVIAKNRSRVEYAQLAIEEMAANAVRFGSSGTIGVEISVKDGVLGKVKRLQIDFQGE
jgi:anti-sigma regulatory factor (Ser/Thr protein kinase)